MDEWSDKNCYVALATLWLSALTFYSVIWFATGDSSVFGLFVVPLLLSIPVMIQLDCNDIARS
jgi:hypothetical protein